MIKNKEENVIELCYVYESGLRNKKIHKTNDKLIEDSLDKFFKRLENLILHKLRYKSHSV